MKSSLFRVSQLIPDGFEGNREGIPVRFAFLMPLSQDIEDRIAGGVQVKIEIREENQAEILFRKRGIEGKSVRILPDLLPDELTDDARDSLRKEILPEIREDF